MQAIITARGAEGTREMRHHHYLKGALTMSWIYRRIGERSAHT